MVDICTGSYDIGHCGVEAQARAIHIVSFGFLWFPSKQNQPFQTDLHFCLVSRCVMYTIVPVAQWLKGLSVPLVGEASFKVWLAFTGFQSLTSHADVVTQGLFLASTCRSISCPGHCQDSSQNFVSQGGMQLIQSYSFPVPNMQQNCLQALLHHVYSLLSMRNGPRSKCKNTACQTPHRLWTHIAREWTRNQTT